MSDNRTSKILKLVTLIIPFELSESVLGELATAGVTAYTSTRADGRGLHGPRKNGFLDSANLRVEILTTPAIAAELFAIVTKRYADAAVVAFSMDVDAVPASHFE